VEAAKVAGQLLVRAFSLPTDAPANGASDDARNGAVAGP